MQRILIEGLELFAYHGVHDAERQDGQIFLLDLIMEADLSAACESDDLEDGVNYSRVIDCAATAFCAQPYKLIERVAQATADAVLAEFTRIEKLTLRVHKPDAPVKHIKSDIIFELKIENNRRNNL